MALINDLFGDIIGCYDIYQKEIFNKKVIRNDNEISWDKREAFQVFDNYSQFYKWVIENRQYSFQSKDDSFFQVYYSVMKNKLVNASLTYIPNPDKDQLGGSYIRFDCNLSSHIDYLHTAYHIHFGYNSQSRICLYRFPFFSEFICFIKHTIYQADLEHLPRQRKKGVLNLDELKFKYFHHFRIIK